MSWDKTKTVPANEILVEVTNETVIFAKEFGAYLGKDKKKIDARSGREIISEKKLTTNQLRKFFGEVKRQQMVGYKETDFVLLKPKLAYAVGRADQNSKIKDFYYVMSNAIDLVSNEHQFKNFIKVFEAIVAYHKAQEAGVLDSEDE